ncbi:MAG: YigZ family protein [Clostridia bacterium]|nr:YigZ family protein [Clostridia bacterium]
MKVIVEDKSSEILIKKSKFLAFAIKINNEEYAERIIDEYNHKYSDATHVVYAYVLSKPAKERCSDDGEPSGTAGKPILDIIKKQNLTNVLVIVVRYFGGIKLGAGGLVRAYAGSAKAVIDECDIVELVFGKKVIAQIPYDSLYLYQNNENYRILNIDYSNIADKKVELCVLVKDEDSVQRIRQVSSSFEDLGEEVF